MTLIIMGQALSVVELTSPVTIYVVQCDLIGLISVQLEIVMHVMYARIYMLLNMYVSL